MRRPTSWFRARTAIDPGPEVADALRLAGDQVHHHNYFTDRRVRERLFDWLCA